MAFATWAASSGSDRLKLNRDDARLLDLIGGDAVEVGLENPLFRRHLERIAGDADQRQHLFERGNAAEHRIEFRQLGELKLFDDLARELARQQDLYLTADAFGVDARALPVSLLVGLGAEEHVLASLDQDARFRFVPRRNEVDAREGYRG